MTDLRLSRLVVLMFVWLQCLAPLLHAHAGEVTGGGLHLPECRLVANRGPDAPGLAGTGRAAPQVVIAMASSLEPREAVLPTLPAMQAGYLVRSLTPSVAARAAGTGCTQRSRHRTRELPYPGAPPSA